LTFVLVLLFIRGLYSLVDGPRKVRWFVAQRLDRTTKRRYQCWRANGPRALAKPRQFDGFSGRV